MSKQEIAREWLDSLEDQTVKAMVHTIITEVRREERENTVKKLLSAMHAFPQKLTPDEVQKCIAENNYAPIIQALTPSDPTV